MSEDEIISLAIQKAVKNGWDDIYFDEYHPLKTIYDHGFARALWGKEDMQLDPEAISPSIGGHFDKYEQPPIPAYKYHLMMMVIADDPIVYLGKNL